MIPSQGKRNRVSRHPQMKKTKQKIKEREEHAEEKNTEGLRCGNELGKESSCN